MSSDRPRRSGPPRRSGSSPPKRSRAGGPSKPKGRSGASRRPGGRRPPEDRAPTGRATEWGSLARKGARRAGDEELDDSPRSTREFTAEEKARYAERVARRAARDDERDRLRSEARDAIDRAESGPTRARPKRATRRSRLPKVPVALAEPEAAIRRLVDKDRAPKLVQGLADASQAYAQERFQDARRLLAPVVRAVPDVAEVAELQGLIHYRLGNWKAAIDQLENFRSITGTAEQHPVLADCHRALGNHADVEELWNELCEASPSVDLVTEGRIVAAGSLADQGRLADALALLEKGWNRPKRAKAHHLRRAYALADLYERHGRAPRARELFLWVQRQDADFGDVARRVAAL